MQKLVEFELQFSIVLVLSAWPEHHHKQISNTTDRIHLIWGVWIISVKN